MDSLSKLKKRGADNIGKVKRSGRYLMDKYSPSILPSFPLWDDYHATNNSKGTSNTSMRKGKLHQQVIEEDKIFHSKCNSYKQHSTVDSTSQFSLNSDQQTLNVNNASTDNFNNDVSTLNPENKFFTSPTRRSTYESFSSSHTLNNSTSNIEINKDIRESSSSASNSSRTLTPHYTKKFARTESFSSVVSSCPTPFDNDKLELTAIDRLDFLVKKNENIPKHLLKPDQRIKEIICNFNHDVAHNEGQARLLNYYELPFPWRENRYIISNYRFYNSHTKSLLSIINWYGWHNETSNIWSHLLGAFFMCYLAIYSFPHSEIFLSETIPGSAKFIVYLFLAASLKCLLASVFWHTFNGTCSHKLRRKFACVDYSGITILITASILTAEFVSLYDHTIPLCLYMGISLTLGFVGIFLNCSPKFDSPESRQLRISFFILLASMGILSFLHASYLESWSFAINLLSPITNKSVVWYLVGVLFYGSFIPERFRTDYKIDDRIPTQFQLATDLDIITKDKSKHFRPEPTSHHRPRRGLLSLWWVDYVGCSHTFWHIFVVLGVIGHYKAIMDMFASKWLQQNSH